MKPRNPVARALRSPRFRSKVVKDKKKTIPRRTKYGRTDNANPAPDG